MSLFSSACSPSACATTSATTTERPALQPVYTITETTDAYSVTIALPGVAKDGLEVTAEDGVLTVSGRRVWQKPDTWTARYRETAQADYRLALKYADALDVDKIQAALADGVLRLTLPKAEASKPRKITVN